MVMGSPTGPAMTTHCPRGPPDQLEPERHDVGLPNLDSENVVLPWSHGTVGATDAGTTHMAANLV
jgi:hypothetical protein